jgi:hypothetical protein
MVVWGAVIPNLTWSSVAREVLLDAKLDAAIPACSTVMACSTSMAGAFQAAGMIDGASRQLALVGFCLSFPSAQAAFVALFLRPNLILVFIGSMARSRPMRSSPKRLMWIVRYGESPASISSLISLNDCSIWLDSSSTPLTRMARG